MISLYPWETVPSPKNHSVDSPFDLVEAVCQGRISANRKEMRGALEALYGREWIQRAEERGAFQDLPHAVTSEEVLTLLLFIGQLVTVEDLRCFLARLTGGGERPELCKRFAFWESYRGKDVYDLSAAEMKALLELFRNPYQTFVGKRPSPADPTVQAAVPFTDLLHYDQEVHALAAEGNSKEPVFYLASPELLARHAAYLPSHIACEGMIAPIFLERGEAPSLVYYRLEHFLSKRGLTAYLWVPLEKGALPDLLLFQGTQDRHAIGRDLDPSGVGKTVFEEQRESLLRMIALRCQERGERYSLRIIGHSLGAADAQRATAALAKALVSSESALNHLERIETYAYCSPHLDMPTVREWEESLSQLAEREAPPAIELHFASHMLDPVTGAGDEHLGPKKGAPFVKANYLIVRSPSGVSQVLRHHTIPFFCRGKFDTATDQRSYELISAEEEKEPEQQRGWDSAAIRWGGWAAIPARKVLHWALS